jgi:hypothetical protein
MSELSVVVPAPRWVLPAWRVEEGRDPLGLQTTTQDRLMPLLLPGILQLSRRARYFSFHAFLLDEYQRRRLPADGHSLSTFIKRREWEYGLAVLHCPHDCGSSPVGARRLAAEVRLHDPPYQRGESVESPFGGYGLYYRTPLAEVGIVARAGTLLGDLPITVDVLRRTDRAGRLAATFRAAVKATAYYQRWMLTSDPLPLEVLEEYAVVACLCRLEHLADERDAVHDALFGTDPPSTVIGRGASGAAGQPGDDSTPAAAIPDEVAQELGTTAVVQRRRSVAHYLTVLDADPHVADDEAAYREGLWAPPAPRNDGHALVAGHWAALIAKDVWQEAICSVWSQFCRAGITQTRRLGRGLTWTEVRDLASSLTGGPPALPPDHPTAALADPLTEGGAPVTVADVTVTSATALEQLRQLTASLDTATSGLVVLLELDRRAQQLDNPGFRQAIAVASTWQPSLAAVLKGLHAHLASRPTIADTLWWLVQQFILGVHERIAYSKLTTAEFTFRFRWEDGLLRFFDRGAGRFPLAGIRREPLSSLTADLGFWAPDEQGVPRLTQRGRAFVDQALS